MKVLLVACIVFGIAQASLPGFGGEEGGGGGGHGAVGNVLAQVFGVKASVFRSLEEQLTRYNGGGEVDLSTNGQVVDGHGSGVAGSSNSYEAPASSSSGGPYAASAVAPAEQGYNYEPPRQAQAVAPASNYGPPPSPPQQSYGPPQQAHAVAPASNYGPPPSPPQQSYGPPQQAHAVAPQSNYGPPQSSYGAPEQAGGYNGASSGSGHSESSHSGSESSSGSGSDSSSGGLGGGFDIGQIFDFKQGILGQARKASDRHWDRKESGLNSLSELFGGLLGGLGGGEGESSSSSGSSSGSSYSAGGGSESSGGPY